MAGVVTWLVVLLVALGLIGGLFFVLVRRSSLVPIIGYDFGSGGTEFRRLPMSKHGGVVWRKKNGDDSFIPLDSDFKQGQAFLADVTTGQGRLIRLSRNREVISMPGDRMAKALFGGALNEIAESSRSDLQKTLRLLVIVGGVGFVLLLGAIVWVIRALNQSGAV